MKISYRQLAVLAVIFTATNFALQAFGDEMWREAIMRSYWECVAFAAVALNGWISGRQGD